MLSCTGGENEQSTDIVSVWEGDSISITCSGSENQVGMYLRAGIQPINVLYVSKENTSYIHPDFDSRLHYSREGSNIRITLHRLRESDSNIYLCSEYIFSKQRPKELNGKTTMIVVKGNASGVIEQSPHSVNPQEGQSVSITCALRSSDAERGIYLLKTHMQPEKVLYVSSQNASTIFPAFANRLEYSKEEKKIVITLHNLWRNDSDIYVCVGVLNNSYSFSANRAGTMMLVKEVEWTNCGNSSWIIYGLIIVLVLLFSALVCCTFHRVDMKKYFQKKNPNAVYEDMSYSSKRSTLVRTNTYSIDN
ncbi:T-cell antigen CD7 [Numenius arquata]|uniref:T-cell antigen CD7 n=1 Tax=Numenius arquata TaxID=31919 RepID=UPI003D304321